MIPTSGSPSVLSISSAREVIAVARLVVQDDFVETADLAWHRHRSGRGQAAREAVSRDMGTSMGKVL